MTFEEWEKIVGAKDPRYDSMVVDIIADWKAEREKLIEALREIAESTHQSYEDKESQYGIGVADGHRCAAHIARAVLEEVENDG